MLRSEKGMTGITGITLSKFAHAVELHSCISNHPVQWSLWEDLVQTLVIKGTQLFRGKFSGGNFETLGILGLLNNLNNLNRAQSPHDYQENVGSRAGTRH